MAPDRANGFTAGSGDGGHRSSVGGGVRLEMDVGSSEMDLWTDVLQSREFHHGVMSSAAIPPGPVHPVSLQPVKGATALGNDPGPGTAAPTSTVTSWATPSVRSRSSPRPPSASSSWASTRTTDSPGTAICSRACAPAAPVRTDRAQYGQQAASHMYRPGTYRCIQVHQQAGAPTDRYTYRTRTPHARSGARSRPRVDIRLTGNRYGRSAPIR